MHLQPSRRLLFGVTIGVLAIVIFAMPRIALAADAQIGPLTDDALRESDPQGYALVMKSRVPIESSLKNSVRAKLKTAGISTGESLSVGEASRAQVLLAAAAYSPYGYLSFKLVPGTGTWTYNGYRGTLYFTYGLYNATVDAYKWFTVSWPAISGNNRPADQSKVSLGPIPEYTWDFGFMSGVWRGYEPDSRVEFYPGQWRLDPWTGAPYGRRYLEVHGGNGDRYFKPTAGCIRTTPSNISALKTYYDTKMANKKDRASAHLTVDY